jgi:hypothetical protein
MVKPTENDPEILFSTQDIRKGALQAGKISIE